ncbi:MAG: hypothetical protein QNJ81_02295 [Acidimicrobiia bacterium]|nr:hypothetical protein [Acidimicrobiia bacterium]
MFNVDETTVDKEESGVWATWRGSQFLIASSGAMKFQRLFQRLQRPHRKAIDKNDLDPSVQVRLMATAMSQALILDWKDVVDSKGEQVPFSQDTAFKVLSKNSEFRDFISEFATEISNFVTEEKEELGKSVEKSSDGKPSSEAA